MPRASRPRREEELPLGAARSLDPFLRSVKLLRGEVPDFHRYPFSIPAYPDARLHHLGPGGLEPIEYEQTEPFALTRDFLVNRERSLKRLLSESG